MDGEDESEENREKQVWHMTEEAAAKKTTKEIRKKTILPLGMKEEGTEEGRSVKE